MKKILTNQWTTFLAGIVLGFSLLQSVPMILAQDTPPTAQAPDPVSVENQACITKMAPYFMQQREQFLKFIESNFKNKLANSALLENALTEYQSFRNRLYAKFMEVADLGNVNNLSLVQRTNELGVCQKRLQQEYDIAEQAMRTYVRGTTNMKRTTALLEKLQGINGKLEGLNSLASEMRGYFQIMANKVPFFVQKCVKQ